MRKMLLAGGGTADPYVPPDPFLVDSFTDTTGTVLTSHVGETGAGWALQSGNTQQGLITAAGRWRCTNNASSACCQASGAPGTNNYKVSAVLHVVSVITANSNTIGVIGRASGSSNTFYHARLVPSSGVWQLYKFLAGTATQLGGNVSVSLTAGDDYTLDLLIVDNTVALAVGGVTVIGPVADASISGPGAAGVRAQGSGVTSDSVGVHMTSIEAVGI